jgi:hypothetical protein
MTDQAGTFDTYADAIVHGAKKGARKSKTFDVGAGAVAGSFFGPWGALAGGFIGLLVFGWSE